MNIDDTTSVLAKCAAFDQRTVGEGDILAWSEALPEWIELPDALMAVTSHYRSSLARAMPAHIIRGSKSARNRRLGFGNFEGD